MIALNIPANAMVTLVENERDGKFWLLLFIDEQPYASASFDTEEEREQERADILELLCADGNGVEMPSLPQ